MLAVAMLHVTESYRARLPMSVLDDIPRLLQAVALAMLCVVGVVSIHDGRLDLAGFVGPAAVGVVALIIGRYAHQAAVLWLRRRGRLVQRCAIVGSGIVANQVIRTLQQDPRYGLRVMGFIDRPIDAHSGRGSATTPRLGATSEVLKALDANECDVVIVTFGVGSDEEIARMVRRHGMGNRTVYVVPRLFDVFAGRGHTEHVGAVPVVRTDERPRFGLVLKRAMDILVSGFALLVTLPVLAIAALAVRLESGRGVLFRQTRIGRDGKPFTLYKFRSMRPADSEEQATRWNIDGDDRIGPVGRFLRRSSIDELPQLWNVLRGQMSLVGPRPERPHFVAEFSSSYPEYGDRHRMRVGLTGLAQVNGLRGDTSIDDRERYDNFYIDNWTLWLDIKVMLATVREIIRAARH